MVFARLKDLDKLLDRQVRPSWLAGADCLGPRMLLSCAISRKNHICHSALPLTLYRALFT